MITTLLKREIEISIKYKVLFFDLFFPIILSIVLLLLPNNSEIFNAILPILLLLTIAGFPAIFMAIKIYTEKKYGVFRSMAVTRMKPADYLISKIIYGYISVALNVVIILIAASLSNNSSFESIHYIYYSLFFLLSVPMATLVGMFATMKAKDFNSVIGFSSLMIIFVQLGVILKSITPNSLGSWIGYVPISGFQIWIEDSISIAPIYELNYGIVVNPLLNFLTTLLLLILMVIYFYKNYDNFVVKEV